MSFGRSTVLVGAWVTTEPGTKVLCSASVENQEAIVSFEGAPPFELSLPKDVLEQCVAHFSTALAKLNTATPDCD